MPKNNIHPDWYETTEVYCDGQLVMTTKSTKPKLYVDLWSGNHPFYTGSVKLIDSEGRVERFMRKYNLQK
jgi:large subunit ribosomal protein L31|nr:ribosomal protein L31 [Meringosphaera mediterranea]